MASVCIHSFVHPTRARIAQLRLEGVGVPSEIVRAEKRRGGRWFGRTKLYYKLMVDVAQEAAAREELAGSLDDAPQVLDRCAKCGCDNVSVSYWGQRMAFLTAMLCYLPLGPWRPVVICPACDAEERQGGGT